MARALQAWEKQIGIRNRFIEPGGSWQNGVHESFNCRFRDECFNRELIGRMQEAQILARACRENYNKVCPHNRIGYQVPPEYRVPLLGEAPGSSEARQAGLSFRPELACAVNSANNPEPKPQSVLNSN